MEDYEANERFDEVWKWLADKGLCEPFASDDYHRVRLAYLETRVLANQPALFIIQGPECKNEAMSKARIL